MSKILVSKFKKSIYEIGLPREQEAIIWDFYVTKSVAASANQKRAAGDYGIKQFPFKEMLDVARISENNIKILLATSMKETLKNLGLYSGKMGEDEELEIEINEPKIACLTRFLIADEKPPKAKVGNAECILTHMRNAFAHGNTYFFDNGNVLFEDKDNGRITARILIRQQTLIDWIGLIDKEEKFYVIHKSK